MPRGRACRRHDGGSWPRGAGCERQQPGSGGGQRDPPVGSLEQRNADLVLHAVDPALSDEQALFVGDIFTTGVDCASEARIEQGDVVTVVGCGPVGLMAVLAAKQMEAGRIVAMSRHRTRQDLALEYGATDIVSERGEAGISRIKELTKGVGADSVLECVGTKESMTQALQCARPGAMIGYVGVPHGVELDGAQLFFSQRGLMGGPAPVRRFLPHLMDLVAERKINPGKVFDLTLPLTDVAEGYRAMDERRAIKTMLRV